MVDLSKKYETVDGISVRLSFIDDNIVYGYIGNAGYYIPVQWHLLTGIPLWSASEEIDEDWFERKALKQILEKKQLSIAISVDQFGKCYLRGAETFGQDFARFTVNVEVEEGGFDKVYYIKPEEK